MVARSLSGPISRGVDPWQRRNTNAVSEGGQVLVHLAADRHPSTPAIQSRKEVTHHDGTAWAEIVQARHCSTDLAHLTCGDYRRPGAAERLEFGRRRESPARHAPGRGDPPVRPAEELR